MTDTAETLVVGKVGAPYGVQGWIKVNSYTDELSGIFEYAPWFIGDENQAFHVEKWRIHKNGLVAKLDGIDDRDGADRIKNLEISINIEQLPALDGDDFYWRELVGMEVKTVKGYHLGSVKEMFATGSNDVMLVDANPNDAFGKKQRMIPYLYDQVVIEVNRESKLITVDWEPDF